MFFCPLSLASFAQGEANSTKTKKVCFAPPLFLILVVFFFLNSFFLLCLLYLTSFVSLSFVSFFLSHLFHSFSSLAFPLNFKEATKRKETMKNKEKRQHQQQEEDNDEKVTEGKTKKRGKQKQEPPPPKKKKVLDHKIESAVLLSRVAVRGSIGSFFR